MTRLRDNPEDLVALAAQVEERFGIPAAFVEKDYWVTELLRSVARPVEDAMTIFKGGTSLSKAHGLIDRFSEDIDILLVVTKPEGKDFGRGSIDRILKAICERAGDDLGLAVAQAPVEPKRGISRSARYIYDARLRSDAVTEGVLLEIGRRGGPKPHARHEVRSFISQYILETGEAREDEFEELAPLEIDVLAPERTLIEKLSLLHRLAVGFPGTEVALRRAGRHLYDVHNVLGSAEAIAPLRNLKGLAAELAADADMHSERWDRPFEPRPAEGFAASPAFDPKHPSSETLRAGYQDAQGLIYGADIPSFEDCIESVRSAADIL